MLIFSESSSSNNQLGDNEVERMRKVSSDETARERHIIDVYRVVFRDKYTLAAKLSNIKNQYILGESDLLENF